MLKNPTFYPTPPKLLKRMIEMVDGHPNRALDPSAGKGDILDALKETRYHDLEDRRDYYGAATANEVAAIEIDPDLRATLRGKNFKVIDSNFLEFAGPDKFDLIMANPPFDHGDLHLLKAIDIMYRGQIIFLLNAETLRNPHTNTRKLLARKLEELNADITYIKNAFKNVDTERKTKVDVALIKIVIERKVEDDLFKGTDKATDPEIVDENLGESQELITGKRIHDLVAEHNDVVTVSTETILAYYKNSRKIRKYIGLNDKPDAYSSGKTLTDKVQATINDTIVLIRKDFWRRTLTLPEVTRRLTEAKSSEFHHQVEQRCDMAFTENNIRQFVLNLMGGFEGSVRESILKLFDTFTIKHSYHGGPNEKNIHYFNGWKTNDAFKVAKRIIIPIHGGHWGGGPFRGYNGWELDYSAIPALRDIDIVMNYFDGMNPNYFSIVEALNHDFAQGKNTSDSTYFNKIIAYKKGTLHLTFADEDILRRFNIEACKGKGWLPHDYGKDYYKDLAIEHRQVVDAFEGKESYVENFGRIGLDCAELDAIEAPKTGQMELFARPHLGGEG